MFKLLIKRALDIVISVVGMVILSPLYLIIAVLVLVDLGWPVLFVQQRTGLRGRPFMMYKFRTMREAYNANGQPLPDAERLTRLGSALRSTSLDELPELLNVFFGHMSLVGPRPLLPQYVERYTPEQARRHEVKPGITGWAQVNGRNALTWEDKFRLDVWYVDNWSLLLDLKILLKTVAIVVTREGISSEGHATMPEFRGTEGSGRSRGDRALS